MARDIKDFIQEKKIEKVDILGHSLGGKVGMKLAIEYPNLVNSLIVVDMSPFSKRNPSEMLTFVKEMKKAQEKYTNRQDIKLALKGVVSDPLVLEFLMTNLIKKDDDSWKFRINLEALERDIPGMLQEEITSGKSHSLYKLDQTYNRKTLFIGGSRADYIKESEHHRIKTVFTNAEFKYLDAGHWIHFEKPREFLELVTGFLKR
jgi:pimeloyl-ACP methyl ester carboxylesterase